MPALQKGREGLREGSAVLPPETHPVASWALGGHSALQASISLFLNPPYFREYV